MGCLSRDRYAGFGHSHGCSRGIKQHVCQQFGLSSRNVRPINISVRDMGTRGQSFASVLVGL